MSTGRWTTRRTGWSPCSSPPSSPAERSAIYSVFIAAFFPSHGGLVLFGLYAFGIIIGLLMAKLFNKTIFKGESSYFIMELPPTHPLCQECLPHDVGQRQ